MSALNQTEPGKYELVVSRDDTDDGISIRVEGEDFPRVTLASAGVLVGDGTEAAAAAAFIDPAEVLADMPVVFTLDVGDEATNLATGTAKKTWRAPFAFLLTDVRISVNTAPVGSTIIVDVKNDGTSVFTTKTTIDASELTSVTAAVPKVIDTAHDDIADDAVVTVNIDQVGSGTPGKGLKVTLYGTRA